MYLIMKKFEMPKFEMIKMGADFAFAGASCNKGTNFEFAIPKTTYGGKSTQSGGTGTFSRSEVISEALQAEAEEITQKGVSGS